MKKGALRRDGTVVVPVMRHADRRESTGSPHGCVFLTNRADICRPWLENALPQRTPCLWSSATSPVMLAGHDRARSRP